MPVDLAEGENLVRKDDDRPLGFFSANMAVNVFSSAHPALPGMLDTP